MDFGDILGDGGFGELDGSGNGANNAQNNEMFMFGMNTQEIEEMKSQKDSVIFLIDCHKTMQLANPHSGADQQSNIEQVLRATLSFIKTKIITNENDKVGIVLFGCGNSENPFEQGTKNVNSLDFKNIHVMYSLDIPDASLIKQLEMKITTFTQDHGYFDEQNADMPVEDQQIISSGIAASSLSGTGDSSVLNTPRSPLNEALWVCHQEFKQVEKQSFSKRIFLFTDSDCPFSQTDQKLALQRAQDLESLNVDIELFPMPNCNQMRPLFDIKRFFANIISFDEDELTSGLLDVEGAQTRLFELMKRIRQKEFKKRTQGKCMFEIAGGAKIGMSFFTTVMPAKKPAASKVNAENNKPLQTTTKLVCEETGQALYRNQIGQYYPLGGEKVRIDQDEMKKIKNFGDNGMKLIGFKPRKSLQVYHNIKHSYFIFPDEKKTTGAGQCTDALIKEMITQDKIAIVKLIPRMNSQVRICAMIAQEEKIDPQDGFQTPAGFQLIQLPYADDMRSNKDILAYAGFEHKSDGQETVIESLTKQEKHAAKLLVKNLNIEFDSRNFENPSIQKFFSGLQALALNEQEPEQIQDDLEPDYEGLEKFAPVINKFKDAFYDGGNEDPECAEKPKKPRGPKTAPASRYQPKSSANRKRIDFESSNSQVSVTSGKRAGRSPRPKKQLDTVPEENEKDNQQKRRKLNDGSTNVLSQRSKNEGKNDRVSAPRTNSQKSVNMEKKYKEACESGSISSFKVAELKEFLTLKSLPATGNKKYLVSIVQEYFDN